MMWFTSPTAIRYNNRINRVLRIFEQYRPRNFHDIGCGEGHIAIAIKGYSDTSNVFGLDIDENAIKLCQSRGINSIKLNLDEESLPFLKNSFDGIFCGELIEHLKDTDHLLEEINRVLMPNGIVVLTTPNLAAWYNRLALLFGYQPFHTSTGYKFNVGKFMRFGDDGGQHIRVFTYKALIQTVLLHKFDIVQIYGAYQPYSPEYAPHLIRAYNLVGKITSNFPSISGDLIFVLRRVSKN